ncbi:MAG: hypothetical protein FWD97_01560 [Defluviitaleaceae bacterium]|nr:hypothetical protein [Defluviitaleaceae bacterium]
MGMMPLILGGDFADVLVRNVAIGLTPILLLALLVTIMIRLAKRKSHEKLQRTADMLEENDEANNARARDVEDELLFHVIMEDLPLREYTAEEQEKPRPVCMWQNKVIQAASKKMLHFDSPKTNVELKKMFGRANLEFVARYEENFVNFIHAMRHWAEALLTEDKKDDAQQVLEIAVEAGSEVSQTYTLLADIYAEANDSEKLTALKDLAESRSLPGKAIVLSHIEKLL